MMFIYIKFKEMNSTEERLSALPTNPSIDIIFLYSKYIYI